MCDLGRLDLRHICFLSRVNSKKDYANNDAMSKLYRIFDVSLSLA
jgi:hypothetical protein